MVNIFKKILNTRTRGNALLLILIISVVLVSILLSISDRIISTEFSIARTAEYEKSLFYSEGFINNIVSLKDNYSFRNCLNSKSFKNSYINISDCVFLSLGNQGVSNANITLKAYAKSTDNNRLGIQRGQSVILRLVDSFTNPQGAPLIGNVVVNTRNCSVNNFVFTRVGWHNNNLIIGKYWGINSTIVPQNWLHVINKQTINVPSYPTLYIYARYIGNSSNCQMGFDVNNSSNNQVIASTSSLEVLLQSDAYLGSNSLVYFRLPSGGSTFVADSIYDYVYFEQ